MVIKTVNDYKVLALRLNHAVTELMKAQEAIKKKPNDNYFLKNFLYWEDKANFIKAQIDEIGLPGPIVMIQPLGITHTSIPFYGVDEELAKILFKERYPQLKIASIKIK